MGRKPRTTRKRVQKKEEIIIFPRWEECRNLEDDEFWREKFDDFSKGKFMRGYTYSGGVLIFKGAKKVNKVTLYSLELPAMIERAKLFLKDNSSIVSKNDYIGIYSPIKEPCEKIQEWKGSKKIMKRNMVSAYVSYCADYWGLDTFREKLEIFTKIMRLIESGDLTDIVVEDGIILEIDGLHWDDEMRTVYSQESENHRVECMYSNLEYTYFSSSKKKEKNIKLSPIEDNFYKFALKK